jgi:hypothetical protein
VPTPLGFTGSAYECSSDFTFSDALFLRRTPWGVMSVAIAICAL